MAQIAMIVGPEFEDSEYRIPLDRLTGAGHEVAVLGVRDGDVLEGKRGQERARVAAAVSDCDPKKFGAVVLPGGHGPDHIRTDAGVVQFLRDFARTERPIAAVCHGPQLLIEADLVRGRKMTSWPSVKTDLQNAGAEWVDQQVVRDGQFITSRNPDDLEAFSEAVIASL